VHRYQRLKDSGVPSARRTLADQLGVAESTARNMLSAAKLRGLWKPLPGGGMVIYEPKGA
jgi:hypothetical protein